MPDLLVDKQDRFTVLTINRPERMNSLGGTVMADLQDAMRSSRRTRSSTWSSYRGG